MKKNWFILLAILLGIGGFFFYKNATATNKLISDLIPDNTLLLLEAYQPNEVGNKSKLQELPFTDSLFPIATELEHYGLKGEGLDALFTNRLLYFAYIPQAKERITWAYFIPLISEDEPLLDQLIHLDKTREGLRLITHTTAKQKIHEIFFNSTKTEIAFFIKDNFLIISPSTLVLEEILLSKKHDWAQNLSLKDLSTFTESTLMTTHVNARAIREFGIKVVEQKRTSAPYLASILPQSWTWYLKDSFLNYGVAAFSVSPNPEIFGTQSAKKFDVANMIPNSCSMVLNISVDQSSELKDNCQKQIESDDYLSKLQTSAKSDFDIDFDAIQDNIQNSVSLLNLEGSDPSKANKIVLIQNKEIKNLLKEVTIKVANAKGQKPFAIPYGSFTVTALGVREFPAMVLGPIFSGFSNCIFTEYKDFIILASDLSTLQEYLLSISRNEVWSSSSRHQSLLKKLGENNIVWISEPNKALTGLQALLPSPWFEMSKETFESSGITFLLYQSNEEKSKFSFLKGDSYKGSSSGKYDYRLLKLKQYSYNVAGKPLMLVNPISKASELLFQTAGNQLVLLNDGKKIWSTSLQGKILGEPQFLKTSTDKKQRLLILTTQKAYVLKREADGFEVNSSAPISGLNSTSWAVAESNNQINIITSNGLCLSLNAESLDETNSFKQKSLENSLGPLPTIGYKGLVYTVCLTENGLLGIVNEKGEFTTGFPVKTNVPTLSAPVLDQTDGQIAILVLGQKGEFFKINMSGKVVQKNQFFRPDTEYKFQLCASDKPNDWVVMRGNNKVVTVLDKNDKELFTIKDLAFGRKYLKYYNLGSGRRFYAIFNGWTSYYLYNEKGEQVSDKPIISSSAPIIQYSDSYNKLIITTHNNQNIETWSIKLK